MSTGAPDVAGWDVRTKKGKGTDAVMAMVPLAGIEPALLAELDFEFGACRFPVVSRSFRACHYVLAMHYVL